MLAEIMKKAQDDTTNSVDSTFVYRVPKTEMVVKTKPKQKLAKTDMKPQKNEEIVVRHYAELHDSSFVLITHESKDGQYFHGDVVMIHSDKTFGSVYFPRSYVKSFEQIPMIIQKR